MKNFMINLFYLLIGGVVMLLLNFLFSSPENDFGPEKTFVTDHNNPVFSPFRPAVIVDMGPNEFFYYVQEADNAGTEFERRIIIRRKKDGIFFNAILKNPAVKLQKGQEMKLSQVSYYRTTMVLAEYLLAEPKEN